jgi:hypothetical protein
MKIIRSGLFAVVGALAPVFVAQLHAQEAPKFVFEGDVVRGAGPTAKGPGCVLNSQFKRGEIMLFRIRVVDPKTGKSIDEKGVKNLQIQLSNGQTAPMSYHQHPPKDPTDYFWSGGWIVPENQPTGSLTYKVVVTDLDGKTHDWSPFKVAGSAMTVVEN